MAPKLVGLRSIWKLATGEAPDLDRARIQVIRDGMDDLQSFDISDANSATILKFVEELSSAQGTLEERMNKLAQELFPPMLSLVSEISEGLEAGEKDRKEALKFAGETKSRIASSMASSAAREHREAQLIREENLRLLIAKAMALIKIHEAVKRMMTAQNAPIQSASAEIADIKKALEMQRKAKMDLAQARRQEIAVTLELDQIIAKRVPEIAGEMQRVAARYLDILDSADVLFGERSTGKQLRRTDAMDAAFAQLCRVQDREQEVMRRIGALGRLQTHPSDVKISAREVSIRMRRALGENKTSKVDTHTHGISDAKLNLKARTEEELNTLATQIEQQRVSDSEAREIIAWAINKNIFKRTSAARIRLAKAINNNNGFANEDRKALYTVASSGIDKMFSRRY